MKRSHFLQAVSVVAMAVTGPSALAQVVIQGSPSADVTQEGGPEVATKGAIVMSATSSSDGGAPVIQSFSFAGDAGAYEMAMPAFAPMVDTGNLSSLLSLPDVREELEMVDDQYAELQEAQKELSKEMSKKINEMMEGGKFNPSKAGGLKELLEEQKTLIESRVQNMLAPHQLERLKQIALHVQMKQSGAIGMQGNKKVQEALDIDEEQLEKLKEKSEEVKEALEEKIEKLKKEAEAEILDELSSKQRKKLEDLMGSSFEYKPVKFQDRIRKLSEEKKIEKSKK